jgi:transposase InsO family protein
MGVALARHGDLAGAEVKLKDANQRWPPWADPLKARGDQFRRQFNEVRPHSSLGQLTPAEFKQQLSSTNIPDSVIS